MVCSCRSARLTLVPGTASVQNSAKRNINMKSVLVIALTDDSSPMARAADDAAVVNVAPGRADQVGWTRVDN